MLPSVSLKRRSRSNRLTQCEPIWGVNAFTPDAPCPHGRRIHNGDYCPYGDCHRMGPRDERIVARSEPPEPKNPETRAAEASAYLAGLLTGLAANERERIRAIRAQIEDLNRQAEQWKPEARRVYRPDPRLKGGLG